MGLCNLPKVKDIIQQRRNISEKYDTLLNWQKLQKPSYEEVDFQYNYAYYPIICPSETSLFAIVEALKANEIIPRRYFYPSLNQLPYLDNQQSCPVSESIAQRALSLPLYFDLALSDVERIATIINQTLS